VALRGNDLGQVVHTNVPLFTKQYKLVPCEGFHINAQYVAANGMGPMNNGSIVVSGLAAIIA